MKHIMVDLETWGTTPGCDLRSIGAVVFDPVAGTLGEEFYVNVVGGDRYGLTKDPSTEKWWSEQSEAAQSRLRIDQKCIADGLRAFGNWWYQHDHPAERADGKGYARFWAHGPHFDEQILAAAVRAALPDYDLPWHYRSPRDLRTVLEAVGLDPKDGIPNYGVEHNALDDAKAQALGVIEAYKRLKHVNVNLSATDTDAFYEAMAELGLLRREHSRRVTELLSANNREVEERRLLARQLVEVRQAGTDLYLAGRWSCDKPVDAASLWTRFRDALGLQPGTATALGIGQETPSRYEQLAGAVRNLRAAQRTYLFDRGNEELGKAVGIAAAEVDRILGDA